MSFGWNSSTKTLWHLPVCLTEIFCRTLLNFSFLPGRNSWWLWWILPLCGWTCWTRVVKAVSCFRKRRSGFWCYFQLNGFISSGMNLLFPALYAFNCNLVCNLAYIFAQWQKTNIIRDYLEDINEIPKSRMFWPREIWSKYVDKLEVVSSSISTHLLSIYKLLQRRFSANQVVPDQYLLVVLLGLKIWGKLS